MLLSSSSYGGILLVEYIHDHLGDENQTSAFLASVITDELSRTRPYITIMLYRELYQPTDEIRQLIEAIWECYGTQFPPVRITSVIESLKGLIH